MAYLYTSVPLLYFSLYDKFMFNFFLKKIKTKTRITLHKNKNLWKIYIILLYENTTKNKTYV